MDRQKEVDNCLLQIAPGLMGKEPTKPPPAEGEEDEDEEDTDPETETSSQKVATDSSSQRVSHRPLRTLLCGLLHMLCSQRV